MNEMRQLMETVRPLFENSLDSITNEIYQKFVGSGWTANQVEYETFEEVLSIETTREWNIEDSFYNLSDDEQWDIQQRVMSRLIKGEEIDVDVADSRGMIGGGLRNG